MPLYAYRCTQCGHKFEKIQNFSAEPESVCPKCGGVLERPLTAPRLNFKGAGWYVNDYAAKSSAPASEGGSATASDAAKTEGAAKPPAESKAPSTSSESAPSAPPSAPSTSSTPSSTPPSTPSSS